MSTAFSQAYEDPDWFVVSPDGSSATRILPGLRIGETEQGIITLNDPEARNQLIRFDVNSADGGWIELMSANHRMVTREGASIRRERLSAGLVVVLPNNRLVISPDLCVCKPNGSLVEVTAAADPEPAASIRTPRRQPRKARRPWLGLLILSVVALSAAALLIKYPALQETAHSHYSTIEDAVRALITESATLLSLPANAAPHAAPTLTLRDETPPADLEEAPEPARDPPSAGAPDSPENPGAAPASEAPDAPDASIQSPGGEIETVVTGAPDRRLTAARQLLSDGFIVSPPGRNAVALLGSLLADQPTNAEGLVLLEECANRLIVQAISAKERGEEFQARNTLEEVLSFNPGNERARRLQQAWIPATR